MNAKRIMPQRVTLGIYAVAILLVGALLGLHFAAQRQGELPLRVNVERLDAANLRRTYQIEIQDPRDETLIRDARVLVITQPRGASKSEITVVATQTEQEGIYRATVPFSHEGEYYIHVALSEPITAHPVFKERIQGLELGAPLPPVVIAAEPSGEFTLRTLADGYSFLLHVAATVALSVALALIVLANRRQGFSSERMSFGVHLFWGALIVLLGTGLYNFVYHTISPAPVPLTLNLGETWLQLTVQNYGEPYAILLALKHLLILALIGLGIVITWQWHAAQVRALSASRQQVGRAVSISAMVLGGLILLLGSALVYLHAISDH